MQTSNFETKTYNISGIDFTRKKIFTLNELDFLTEFYKAIMPGQNNRILQGTFSNKDIVNFLSIVLETESILPDDFSFANCNEQIAGEVFFDFMKQKADDFLKSFKTTININEIKN